MRALVLMMSVLAQPLASHAQDLRFDPARVPVGRVFHYLKSNMDGTHPARIHVYVRTQTTVESFKADEGETEATIVLAEMNWTRFSVRRFESARVNAAGVRTVRATLTQEGETDAYVLKVGDTMATATVAQWPWHSYDFDFAGLGLTLPHLVDPARPHTFGRSDFIQDGGPPRFGDLGAVTLTYLGEQRRRDAACRKYRIDGPGLQNKGGLLWADTAGGHIVEFEIAIPDEPGFTSGRLVLESIEPMTSEQWAAFITKTLTP